MVMDTLYLMSSLIHIIWIVLYGLLWSQSLWPSKVYIDFIRFSSAGIHAPEPVGTRTVLHQDQKDWNYRTAPSRTRNKYSWEIKDRYDGQMTIIDEFDEFDHFVTVIFVSVILVVSVNLVMKRSFWSWTDGHIGKNTVISGYRIFSKIHDSLSSIGI